LIYLLKYDILKQIYLELLWLSLIDHLGSSDDTAGLQEKVCITDQIQTIFSKTTDQIQTDFLHIFQEYRPPFLVSSFFDQNLNIVQSQGSDLQGCLLWKDCFNLLKTDLNILTYFINKESGLVYS